MITLQFIQTKLQRLIGCAALRCRCRRSSRFRSGSVAVLWNCIRLVGVLIGIRRHGLGVEMEPLDGLHGRRMDGDLLHPGDKVEGVAAMFAFAETVPDVFGDTHPELCWIAAFVNRTRPAQAVS